jgi:cytochrome c biogenesis protein CcmG/thiol:disulfide interchange protein DsbE
MPSRIAASVLAIVLLTLVPTHHGQAEGNVAQTRRQAPDFALPDASGKTFRLAAHRGKVVLVDFWATWCGGCKIEIPWFVEFQAKYRRQGLVSVGVAMDDEGWSTVRPYLAQHPIAYPVVIGDLNLLQGAFGLTPALPITLLIDRQGRIAESHVGVVDRIEWEKKIVALLAAK